mgnify:CR=1 FL=1
MYKRQTLSLLIANSVSARKTGCEGDCENGSGTWTYTDQTVYKGEWLNSKKHGKGIETWPNGYIYEGDFFDSKWQGDGTLTFPDGSKYFILHSFLLKSTFSLYEYPIEPSIF